MSAVFASAYVSDSTAVTLRVPSVTASAEASWGAVAAAEAYSFESTAQTPAPPSMTASSYAIGGNYAGTDSDPIPFSVMSLQGPNVTPPAPSGEQLTFHWSTG